MKIASIILFLFISTCYSVSAQEWDDKYGWPIISLTETNPWLMVIGSDVPTIVIYEHGDIIYKQEINNKVKYYNVKLENSQVLDLISSLSITDSLRLMPEYTMASSFTDQPTNELILVSDSVYTRNVYGNLRNGSEDRKIVPQYFLNVYDRLIEYKNNNAHEWIPEKIEIMLTSFDYSKEKPIEWPNNWPDLESSETVNRSDMLYSVYLPKTHYNDFLKLISKLDSRQAVKINGKLFSVSYRMPFPNLR